MKLSEGKKECLDQKRVLNLPKTIKQLKNESEMLQKERENNPEKCNCVVLALVCVQFAVVIIALAIIVRAYK